MEQQAIEEKVAGIVCRLANLASLAPEQDYFDAGLASVQALELLLEVESEFGVSLSDEEFAGKPGASGSSPLITAQGGRLERTEGACESALATPATTWRRRRSRSRSRSSAAGIGERALRVTPTLEFDADEAAGGRALAEGARALAERMQRSLRSLKRKVAYRSPAMDTPRLPGHGDARRPVVRSRRTRGSRGPGAASVRVLRPLLRRVRARRGSHRRCGRPTLIPASVLARCDYFRSFPHSVTFACHLPEDPPRVEDFRRRHQDRESLDERAMADMVTPEACLSPAVCYHAYAANRDRDAGGDRARLLDGGQVLPLRVLEHARPAPPLGLHDAGAGLPRRPRAPCSQSGARGMEAFQEFLDEHHLAGEIRTASDPFFIAPDSAAKTYFQISSETKFEISLAAAGRRPAGRRLVQLPRRLLRQGVPGARAGRRPDAQRVLRLGARAMGVRIPRPARLGARTGGPTSCGGRPSSRDDGSAAGGPSLCPRSGPGAGFGPDGSDLGRPRWVYDRACSSTT